MDRDAYLAMIAVVAVLILEVFDNAANTIWGITINPSLGYVFNFFFSFGRWSMYSAVLSAVATGFFSVAYNVPSHIAYPTICMVSGLMSAFIYLTINDVILNFPESTLGVDNFAKNEARFLGFLAENGSYIPSPVDNGAMYAIQSVPNFVFYVTFPLFLSFEWRRASRLKPILDALENPRTDRRPQPAQVRSRRDLKHYRTRQRNLNATTTAALAAVLAAA